MKRRDERWTEQDVALVKARRAMKHAIKAPPLEAIIGRSYSFTVPGLAQPGGSKQAFVPLDKNNLCTCGPKPLPKPYRRDSGGVMVNVTDANPKVGKWKKYVANVAHQEYAGPIFDGFLRFTCIFYQPRPKAHYTSTGKLSKQGLETPWPNVKPDVLKLARAVEDALTGLCWTDDAIIVKERTEKEYGTPARVEITIEELVLPAEQEQTSLFGDLEPPAPWETAGSAADRPRRPAGTSDPTSDGSKSHGTSDAGKNHSDRSQTQASDAPAPWETPDPATPEKKEKISRHR